MHPDTFHAKTSYGPSLFNILLYHSILCFSYRVLAIDHDIFSFVDVRLNTWPIILITNPKDAHYVMPPHEPLGRMRKSTHIRLGIACTFMVFLIFQLSFIILHFPIFNFSFFTFIFIYYCSLILHLQLS